MRKYKCKYDIEFQDLKEIMDFVADKYGDNIGFFTFALTISCFFISVIFRDNFVVSFLNATAFNSIFCAGLIFLYFLFFHVFAGKGSSLYYFFAHYFSRIIYTILTGILLYYLNKYLSRSLRDN